MFCGYRGLKNIPRMFLESRDVADAVWITVRGSSKCIERMPRWINRETGIRRCDSWVVPVFQPDGKIFPRMGK
jgi:hypothetical protein